MPTFPVPFITPIDATHVASARFLLGVEDLNTGFEEWEKDHTQAAMVTFAAGIKPSRYHTEDDLVGILLDDPLYRQLLQHEFFRMMKTAPASDVRVLNGFRRYMAEDFHYCVRAILSDTERAHRARERTLFQLLAKKIASHATYADTILTTCADRLGMDLTSILTLEMDASVKHYTNWLTTVASTYPSVISMVAAIPCIQSYVAAAFDLWMYSKHTDTVWYKVWVLENIKYQLSAKAQRDFFIFQASVWQSQRPLVRRIFQQACKYEIALWNVAARIAGGPSADHDSPNVFAYELGPSGELEDTDIKSGTTSWDLEAQPESK